MGLVYELVSVMEYLDELIKVNEAWQAAKDFNGRTYAACGPEFRRIHLTNDVECFADILKAKVNVDRIPLPDGMVCVRTSFEYKGYEVFQVKAEAMEVADARNQTD